ncbi:synaptophysin / synaptoporin [Dictyocaulus viviparus]|uniref:Synaptophysin / synaptoporin n=1 Tax=Dictyocaulus viviparus TaxID=29172 RepID=A0A0D8Y1N5_DICVI|nr:synaptophysin / synaptoporin [Dictyocaulus viviparus]
MLRSEEELAQTTVDLGPTKQIQQSDGFVKQPTSQILGFIAFILAICADRRSTTAAWTEHITFETTIVVSALLAGYVCFPHLTIREEPTREGLIVLELIFYGINTLFYFISIWLMVHLSASWGTDGRGAAIMTAIICVSLTIIFAIETFLKLKAWRGENEPSIKVINTVPQPSQS